MREKTDAHQHQTSPRIAAALNLLPLPVSLGYAYLDRPVRFAISTVLRCVALAVTWTYLCCHFIESCGTESCPPDAGALPLMIVPSLLVLAYTALDARSVAVAHGRNESPPAGQAPRSRRAGVGALTVMGTLALLALGALLRTGDAVSFVLIVAVTTGGWLTWRQGMVRLPANYRPPDKPKGPPTE